MIKENEQINKCELIECRKCEFYVDCDYNFKGGVNNDV